MSVDEALSAARSFLAAARNADGGWGYLAGAVSEPEPTVLCAGAGVGASLPWLETADLGFADLLVPAALGATPGAEALIAASVQRILALRGVTWPDDRSSEVPVETAIAAWPWVDGTFSWSEPTAYAVLSLKKAGQGAHPRALDGVVILKDRQCPDGGWNFGNPVAFGRPLDSDIAPTAWASLALGAGPEADRGRERVFHALEIPSSLGLSAALAAWTTRAGCRTAPDDARVAQLVDRMIARQRPDGSFGGRVDWTALGVAALDAWQKDGAHVFAL